MMGHSDRSTFLVVSAGRSGSTLLVNLLNCHPDVTCHGEILNPEQSGYPGIERDDCDRIILHVRSVFESLQCPRTGAKIHISQLEELSLPLDRLTNVLRQPRIVLLYRRNLLATYVSLLIAQRNGRWYSRGLVNRVAVRIDWERFLEYAVTERRRWQAVLGQRSTPVHVLTYEQLRGGLQKHMDRVFGFLGLPTHPVRASSVRQNPWPLSRKIVNFDDLPLDCGRLPAAALLDLSKRECGGWRTATPEKAS